MKSRGAARHKPSSPVMNPRLTRAACVSGSANCPEFRRHLTAVGVVEEGAVPPSAAMWSQHKRARTRRQKSRERSAARTGRLRPDLSTTTHADGLLLWLSLGNYFLGAAQTVKVSSEERFQLRDAFCVFKRSCY